MSREGRENTVTFAPRLTDRTQQGDTNRLTISWSQLWHHVMMPSAISNLQRRARVESGMSHTMGKTLLCDQSIHIWKNGLLTS